MIPTIPPHLDVTPYAEVRPTLLPGDLLAVGGRLPWTWRLSGTGLARRGIQRAQGLYGHWCWHVGLAVPWETRWMLIEQTMPHTTASPISWHVPEAAGGHLRGDAAGGLYLYRYEGIDLKRLAHRAVEEYVLRLPYAVEDLAGALCRKLHLPWPLRNSPRRLVCSDWAGRRLAEAGALIDLSDNGLLYSPHDLIETPCAALVARLR